MSCIFGYIQNKFIANCDFENVLSAVALNKQTLEIILFSDDYVFLTSVYIDNNITEFINRVKNSDIKGFYGFFLHSSPKNKAYSINWITIRDANQVMGLKIQRDYVVKKGDNTIFFPEFPDFKQVQYIKNPINNTGYDLAFDDIPKSIDTFVYFNLLTKSIGIYRNQFGKGSIYYYSHQNIFVFCDKIRPLQRIQLSKCFNNYAHWSRIIVNEQLAAGSTHETMYKNIYQVMQGECIQIKNYEIKRIAPQPIPITINKRGISENASAFLDLFLNSFESCVKDVSSFGISLSGGLDSACIVAAGNLLHHKAIKTYSVAFDNNPSKDNAYIKLINDFYNCESNVITEAEFDFYQISDSILEVTEHPFYDSGAIGHYLVLQKAANTGITTLLDGEGAEVAAGPDDIVDFFPYYNSLFLSLKWWHLLKNYHFYNTYGLKKWFKIFVKNKLGLYNENAKQWLNPDFYQAYFFKNDTHAIYKNNYHSYNLDAIYRDYIPHAMLCKCKLADAFGINYQFPFINEALLGFALGILEKQKVVPPYTKYILRKAFEKALPSEVFKRKDKMVYSGPNLAPFLHCDGKYYKTTIDIIKNSQLCKQKIVLWERVQHDLYPFVNVRLLSLCRLFDLFTANGSDNKNW